MRLAPALLGSLFLAAACGGGGGGGGPQPSPGVAPTISSQPADTSRTVGQTATFQVSATGTSPLAYQWRRNGTSLPGATADAFTTTVLAAGDDGARFSVQVSNAYGSATSREAVLTVTQPPAAPAITTQPADTARSVGQTATFQVAATGTAPLAFQWRRDGTNLPGATTADYTTPPLALADDGALYSVRVTNAIGSATSRDALLRVTVPGACPKMPAATGFQVLQAPALAEPAPRTTYTDPVFGACVTRVTDRAHDPSGGDASAGLKNEYSRVQAFNADESCLLIRGIDSSWYVYDAGTLLPLRRLPFDGSVDPRWDAADPHRLHFNDGTRLMRCDVRSGDPALVRDFAPDFPGAAFVWTRWEGSPSADGRWWGFMAQDGSGRVLAFLVYDLQTNTIAARRDFANFPGADSVTISPSGNYFVVQVDDYCATGALGTDANPCGLMVYDKNLQNGRGLLRIVGHSDLGYDTQGREVLVYQDIDTDRIAMVELATGLVTQLWPIDFSHTPIGLHFSGRAFQRPGWALVSTHDGDTAAHAWMDDSVFAIELKANGQVLRLAHTRSLVDEQQQHDYWAEPQASVNRDFTKVVFTSNWGRSGTGATECLLVELPVNWVASLPTATASRPLQAPNSSGLSSTR